MSTYDAFRITLEHNDGDGTLTQVAAPDHANAMRAAHALRCCGAAWYPGSKVTVREWVPSGCVQGQDVGDWIERPVS